MNILDQYALPLAATDAMQRFGLQSQDVGRGVTRHFAMTGHCPFRFFVNQEKNPKQSKASGYFKPDAVHMIQWYPDRFTKPTERVTHLPEELLQFEEIRDEAKRVPDAEREPVGGMYLERYLMFVKQLKAPGLSLAKWGELDDTSVAILAHEGIFSVEDLAVADEKAIRRFPEEIQVAFGDAILWNAAKTNRIDADAQGEKIVALEEANAKMSAEMEQLRRMIKGDDTDQPKKKRTKK